MKKQLLTLGIMGLLAPLTGCVSFTANGLARTLNAGAVQGWVAPGAAGGAVLNAPKGASVTTGVGYPMLEGGVRVGVTDRIELGGRGGFNGITFESKFGILRPETTDAGVNLSLNPTVGFIGFGGGSGAGGGFVGVLTFQLPVLIGIDFGGHELVIGPRIADQILFGTFSSTSGGNSSTANIFYVGGSVGFAIKVSGAFRIMPEIAIGVPAVASVNDAGSSVFNSLIIQGGVAFLFGSRNQYDPEEPPHPVGSNKPDGILPGLLY